MYLWQETEKSIRQKDFIALDTFIANIKHLHPSYKRL